MVVIYRAHTSCAAIEADAALQGQLLRPAETGARLSQESIADPNAFQHLLDDGNQAACLPIGPVSSGCGTVTHVACPPVQAAFAQLSIEGSIGPGDESVRAT